MCHSFEASINNWFLILLISAYLIVNDKGNNISHKTNIWIASFVLTFGQIQILEAMIWNELNNPIPNQQTISKLVSYIPLLLWAQPLVQCLGAYYVTKNSSMLYLSFVYVTILIYEYMLGRQTDTFTVRKDTRGLVWLRFDAQGNMRNILGHDLGILYIAGLLIPLFYMPDQILKYSLITYGILSMLYSWLYAGPAFSSYWCYIAIGYGLIAVLKNVVS